jgi:hypothetical protein
MRGRKAGGLDANPRHLPDVIAWYDREWPFEETTVLRDLDFLDREGGRYVWTRRSPSGQCRPGWSAGAPRLGAAGTPRLGQAMVLKRGKWSRRTARLPQARICALHAESERTRINNLRVKANLLRTIR